MSDPAAYAARLAGLFVMDIREFDYDLPADLIAQHPLDRRDQSRLLVVDRATSSLRHQHFLDLPNLLSPKDLLVLNDTRVLPARLLGHREKTGGKWEGLFLRQASDGRWELLSQTRGRLSQGEFVVVESTDAPVLRLRLHEKTQSGSWLVEPLQAGDVPTLLARYGQVPLPPYIRKGIARPEDEERYQTVYSRATGAVAAPTAGLHFTPELFARLDERGICKAFVTLHVGLGTFQPIQVEDIREHRMHTEWGELPAATARAVEECRERGGRVVAVGTTSVRVLETASRRVDPGGAHGGRQARRSLKAWSGDTDLFIYPPFEFQVVDALITNFHLPRSTLLLLVSAFAGVDLMRKAYKTAIEERYRFYSYGDAMLIV